MGKNTKRSKLKQLAREAKLTEVRSKLYSGSSLSSKEVGFYSGISGYPWGRGKVIKYWDGYRITHKTIDDTYIAEPTKLEENTLYENIIETPSSSVFTLFPEINLEILEYIKSQPSKIFTLSPREFEELIAAIFKNQGFHVELTPETRDGGVDIIAVEKSIYTGETVHLIECKRWAPENKVGFSIVQRMLGAIYQYRANKGAIVTTSSFTSNAREVASQQKNFLTLADYKTISSWLGNWHI